MKEMVFWGATGQAKVLRECLEGFGLKLSALFDNNEETLPPFDDIPLYFGKKGFEEWLEKMDMSTKIGCLVAIGGDRGKDRLELQKYMTDKGLTAIIAKHPTAFIAGNATLGKGTQVLAQASVCAEAVIGRGSIVNTGAIVEHECCLGDGVHIAPGAVLAGCVNVEHYATVYSGAVVLPGLKIGEDAIVGAGSVVTEDVEPRTVVAGSPARVIRSIT